MTQKNIPQHKKNFEEKIPPTPFTKGALKEDVANPLWLSVSEAAKLGGVQTKTIRRAIQSNVVKYKVVGNRYLINLSSMIIYLNSKKKLKNKFDNFGIGQYYEVVKSIKS